MERCDLLLVLVDAGDVVTEIRKAGSGHQSHIARSDHRDSHEKLFPLKTDVPLNTLDHFCIRPHAQH
jgi:hypothetical protein